VWDIEIWKEHKILRAHSNVVGCIDFSMDFQFVASGGWDNAIFIWDINKDFK